MGPISASRVGQLNKYCFHIQYLVMKLEQNNYDEGGIIIAGGPIICLDSKKISNKHL